MKILSSKLKAFLVYRLNFNKKFFALIIYKLYFIMVFDQKVKKYLKYKPKRKPKAVIYSADIGSYDRLIVPTCIDFDIDYVFYTDNKKLLSKKNTVWEFRPAQYMELDNSRNSRWHKTQPHLLFPEKEISIWIDSNIEIKTDFLYKKIDEFIKSNSIFSISIHFERDCIYEEIEKCKELNKDDHEIMSRQIELLRDDLYPEKAGLFENFILLRKHNDESIIKLMEDWWQMIKNYSRRDQLSLNYLRWKQNFKIDPIDEKPLRKMTEHLTFWPHDSKLDKISIHQLTSLIR